MNVVKNTVYVLSRVNHAVSYWLPGSLTGWDHMIISSITWHFHIALKKAFAKYYLNDQWCLIICERNKGCRFLFCNIFIMKYAACLKCLLRNSHDLQVHERERDKCITKKHTIFPGWMDFCCWERWALSFLLQLNLVNKQTKQYF